MTGFSGKPNAPKARYNARFGDFKNLAEPKAVHAPKPGALPAALHPVSHIIIYETEIKVKIGLGFW